MEVFSVGVRLVALDRRVVLTMAEMGIDISTMPRRDVAVAISGLDSDLCDYGRGYSRAVLRPSTGSIGA